MLQYGNAMCYESSLRLRCTIQYCNDGCAYRVQHRGSVNVMRPTCSISRRR